MPRPARRQATLAGLGAALALGVTGLVGPTMGAGLVAPLGATSFLLFVLPNSPLAQPWSAVVGNAASALVGALAAGLGARAGLPLAASAGLAVGAAILAMAALRAMHPPGGAVALLVALGGEGPGFASPVLLDTAALVLLAMAWHRLDGRRYPFRQPRGGPPPVPGLTSEEMAALLARANQAANIGTEDFSRLLAAAQAEAARHRRRR